MEAQSTQPHKIERPLRKAHDMLKRVNFKLLKQIFDSTLLIPKPPAKATFGGLWLEDLPRYMEEIAKVLQRCPEVKSITIKVGWEDPDDHHVFLEILDVEEYG